VSRIAMLLKYLQYRKKAKGPSSVHSPFVFDFINDVLRDQRHFYAYDDIARVRNKLLSNTQTIEVTDYGAGSQTHPKRQRSLRSLAKDISIQQKYGKLLFRMVNYFMPQHILELGSCIGLGAAYLAMARSSAQVITLEGCPQTAAVATQTFDALSIKNIELIEGPFEKVLPVALHKLPVLDFVYFDGNHRKEATLDYFTRCIAQSHENTVFVFDDIHWSQGMEQAWETICKHPKVTLSFDLFQCGIVFFRGGIAQQHFVLKF